MRKSHCIKAPEVSLDKPALRLCFEKDYSPKSRAKTLKGATRSQSRKYCTQAYQGKGIDLLVGHTGSKANEKCIIGITLLKITQRFLPNRKNIK